MPSTPIAVPIPSITIRGAALARWLSEQMRQLDLGDPDSGRITVERCLAAIGQVFQYDAVGICFAANAGEPVLWTAAAPEEPIDRPLPRFTPTNGQELVHLSQEARQPTQDRGSVTIVDLPLVAAQLVCASTADRPAPDPEERLVLLTLSERLSARVLRGLSISAPRTAPTGPDLNDPDAPQCGHRPVEDLEKAKLGLWEWDAQSGTNMVNKPWLAMLGYDRDALDPVNFGEWRNLVHPEDRRTMAHAVTWMTQHRKDEFDQTIRMRHAAGHWVWVQTKGRVIKWSPEGQPLLMTGVHLDVSELKATEERLKNIIEGAQVGVWDFDTRTGRNVVSNRWAEMLGYGLDDLDPMMPDPMQELVHPTDYAAMLATQKRLFTSGQWNFAVEMRMMHRAGHWVWVLSRGRVTEWDEFGVPVQMSGVHIDISQEKALEVALEAERDFLARLMETSVSGIMALDSDGVVIFANKEAESVLGIPAADLVGMPYDQLPLEVVDEDGVPVPLDESQLSLPLLVGQTLRDQRVTLKCQDGSRRLLSVNAAPMRVEGQSVAMVCAATDVTEAVQADAILRASIGRAEAGNRAKSEFLSTMSHEIRTPLNGVLGMAEILGKTLTTPEQVEMLQTIRQSGALLLAVINDILDLAKIESGQVDLQDQPFRPFDLGTQVEALHEVPARAKGVALNLWADAGARRMRRGDAQRVLQILHNLVGNAVKFSDHGAVNLRITARGGGPVVIEVSDDGIGMSEVQLARVFEDFVQADGTITRRFGGTGLGLAIVRRLVEMMAGTILVTSQLGQGTRVTVELPLPEVPADPHRAEDVSFVAPAGLLHRRALVAEDNATNRVIVRSMLEALGLHVTMAEDGNQAASLWRPGQFDVLLLDISMPGKDGISALDAIRGAALALGAVCPPAVAVTANAMTHHITEYLAAGFAGCVAKPICLEDLAAVLERAIAPKTPHFGI